MKSITLGIAIVAMLVGQYLVGIPLDIAEIIMFPTLSIVVLYLMVLLLKNIDDKKYRELTKKSKIEK